jgi:phospho-N-acetylmuramoyl-pentapeptide-transferase
MDTLNLIGSSRNLGLILGSTLAAFVIVLILTEPYTKFLKKFQFGQQITTESSISKSKTPLFASLHKKKTGTPTMGGVLIWGSVLLIAFISPLLSKLGLSNNHLINRAETYLPLFTLGMVALLGLVDDILNVKKIGKAKGLPAIVKFIWLLVVSGIGAWWFHSKLGYDSITLFNQSIEIGAWYIPLFMFVFVGSANAVNITDGLDGLAAGLTCLAFLCLAIISYMQGLFILTTLCGIIIGATSAFLWFNVPPAKFFMGDTGSLTLGATMAVIAFLTDSVLVLPFIGFIFVIETLSVIAQMISKKFRNGKKIFHIAPVHHHFEYIGWPEFRVTMRFWMIGGFMAAFGLILHLAGIV